MIEAAVVGTIIWVSTGAIIVLCACEFLGAKPSSTKVAAAMLAGPLCLNRKGWEKNDAGS